MPYDIDTLLPEGFTELNSEQQQSTIYDFEAINNDDDKELWLIRVPEEVSAESLTSMKIKLSKTPGKPVSKLELNDNEKFTMYRVPEGTSLASDVGVSGQEMFGFSCLVPSDQGKMVFAPTRFTQCLILDEEVTIPDGTQLAESIRDSPVTKRQHPEGLKMRFKPYGFDTCEPEDVEPNQIINKDIKKDDQQHTDKKRKKHKVDDDDNDKKKKKKEKKAKK
ncbi:DNA-directed RNA polymerase I, subunit RPA34.5 [Halteromyces radiatus]|uniref:DNA-directed RNA polymerase I, subunit RPA34.5 n=1 Tax=Halteromyces radiatus TaxID=101107 RepID=UPI002220FF09|nr:DNA-directed RNA polymerase I, subunit RPA34.5 [Halteromyces radiatus]KAI8096932.1 DNA-directed RNA polymerase I, subunit RPA34.5 [Halteromyces radiatus]